MHDQRESLHISFNFNGHTLGFDPPNKKLEPWVVPQEKFINSLYYKVSFRSTKSVYVEPNYEARHLCERYPRESWTTNREKRFNFQLALKCL